MINIPGSEVFLKIEPINNSWTGDKKYYIETYDGQRLLLHVADTSEYERNKNQYNMLQRTSEQDISISYPVELGLCDDNKSVYQLLIWVNGEDVESVLRGGLEAHRSRIELHCEFGDMIIRELDLNFWNAYTYYFAYGTLIALASTHWARFTKIIIRREKICLKNLWL